MPRTQAHQSLPKERLFQVDPIDRPPLGGDLSGADEEALIGREARPINAD